MATYYFVAASEKFMTEVEPLFEVLDERVINYQARNKPIDFWRVDRPQFLERPELATVTKACPRPAVAVVSTDPYFIRWLKNRLVYVISGEVESDALPV